MAHVQRRCQKCRRSVPQGTRACPECGAREIAFVARYRDPSHAERSRSFERKTDAERFLHGQETSKARGDWIDPALGRVTIDAFWPRFLEASPHLRPSTRALYGMLARRYLLPQLGARQLSSVTRLDVEAFVAALPAAGVGAATTNAAYRLLRGLLAKAEAAGMVARNVARGVAVPRPPRREMRFLSAEELHAVADAVGARDRALILLLGLCGLRIGEAAALKVGDLELLRRTVRITKAASEVGGKVHIGPTKTGEARAVPLPLLLAEELARHLAEHPPGPAGLVFSGPDGGVLRRTNWRRRVWLPALRGARIAEPLPRPHDLRHTAAALAIGAGAHSKQIQAMLGHSSSQVTLDRYGHLFPSLAENLAEALDATMRAASAGPLRDRRGTGTVAVLRPGGEKGG